MTTTQTPLIYQPTRYDCGPTTLINALRYLYSREELDPALEVAIYQRTLDDFNEQGELGKQGTSHQAIRNVIRYFDGYGSATGFPIHAYLLNGDSVLFRPGSAILAALADGAVGVARVWHNHDGHYILLTGIEDGRILVFDPSATEDTLDADRIVAVDQPYRANRSVIPEVFNVNRMANYALKNAQNADPTDPQIGEIGVIKRL